MSAWKHAKGKHRPAHAPSHSTTISRIPSVVPSNHATISRRERLAMFPREGLDLRARAEVLWDPHLVPFIHADHDEDVPYLLGLVHAFLRLGQMELYRRIAAGRVAEIAGAPARRLDHAIRAIDLARAVPEIIERMDPRARAWGERYVAGINDLRRLTPATPPDCRTMAIDPAEAWTLADMLTFGRLASADINWGKWAALLALRHEHAYDDYLDRLRRFAEQGTPTFGPGTPTPLDALLDVGKTGSNAFTVSPSRSATGAALLAGDPHLGLPQPNIWCIAGYRSPRRAAAGLTIPGLPFVLVGRNEHIAWGGTNMHSLSSLLYELGPTTPLRTRTETLRTRWGRPAAVTIRESDHGPVISDAPAFRRLADNPVALRWRGHDFSDEAAAMLRLGEATCWEDFRAAFTTWCTGGQNFLYADTEGNIGQVMAVEAIPAAGRAAFRQPVPAGDPRYAWNRAIPSTALPAALNPDQGFLVSANNVPARTDPPIMEYANTNDRVHRLTHLLASNDRVAPDDLLAMQRDTFSESSLAAARAIVGATPTPSARAAPLAGAIRAWNGHYDADSAGALAYQRVLHHLLKDAYTRRYSRRIRRHLARGLHVHTLVREDIEARHIDPTTVARAIERAARGWRPDAAWGHLHRIGLDHPIGRAPIIGRRYRFGSFPTGGSSGTVHKSTHPVTRRRHTVRFGACARHVFDMADLDASRIVLLGGQDGWIGSEHMLDQAPLWERGRTIPLPLRAETQRANATDRIELHPAR